MGGIIGRLSQSSRARLGGDRICSSVALHHADDVLARLHAARRAAPAPRRFLEGAFEGLPPRLREELRACAEGPFLMLVVFFVTLGLTGYM